MMSAFNFIVSPSKLHHRAGENSDIFLSAF